MLGDAFCMGLNICNEVDTLYRKVDKVPALCKGM